MPQIFRFFHSGSFSASSSSSDSSANMGSGWVLSEETSQPVQNRAARKINLHVRTFILVFLAGSKVAPVWDVDLENSNIHVTPEEKHLRSHTKVISPSSEGRGVCEESSSQTGSAHMLTANSFCFFTIDCVLLLVRRGDPVGVFCSLLGVT